jgi:hypothetical protein
VKRNFEYSTPLCAVKIEPFKVHWLLYVPAGLRTCLVPQPGVLDSTGNVPFIMSPSMTDLSPVSAVASRYSLRVRYSDKRDRSKSSSNLCLDTRWRWVGTVTLSPTLPSWKMPPVRLWLRMNTTPTAGVQQVMQMLLWQWIGECDRASEGRLSKRCEINSTKVTCISSAYKAT